MSKNKILDGLLGVCVGDALGVPVEFEGRDYLDLNPVIGMQGYGTWNQPPGTWSDDSSLTFCLAESLCEGYNLKDIGDKFCKWLYEGYWTADGKVFDVGGTTKRAIQRIKAGISSLQSGGTSQTENGNGSLMRILPIVYYTQSMDLAKRCKIVQEVSSITHAHSQSVIACQIYIEVLVNILQGTNIYTAYENMKPSIREFYQDQEEELEPFDRILEKDIFQIPRDKISSKTYVISSLEAALWCSLKHTNYTDTVLEAINLGGDTDTIGAIAGGIAGICYGFENIPSEWLSQIARKQDIKALAERLNISILREGY